MDVTPKVILDTNMVYYICGLSSPHHLSVSKVLSYLNENQNQINQINFAISSVSFNKIIYVFLTIFLYLLKCPQSLILSALRAFCFCGKPRISRSIFLYFPCQSWLKSW